MTDIPFNRRLFNIVLWIFAGLCLLVILTSCSALDPFASLATVTPSLEPIATHTAAPIVPTIATSRPIYQVISDSLEVRAGASESAQHLDYLKRGQTVTIYSTQQAEREYCPNWAAINPSLTRWVCMKFLGE